MKKVLTLIVAIMLLFTTTVCIPVLAEDKGNPTLVLSDGSFQKSYTHTKLQLKNAPGDDYEYKFIVYNSTSKQWYKLQDYSDATEINWYTGQSGLKTLFVDVRNKELNQDYRRISLPNVYVTEKGLSISKFISSEGNELDEKSYTTLIADADKGNSPYEYKFIVHNDRTGQWYKIQDFSSNNTATWYTSGADQKTLYVDVKDADGVVVRQELSVTVETDSLFLKADHDKVLEDEEVTITFEASGRRNQTVELYGDDSLIGTMHDDGKNGDLVENDGIYSLSVSLLPSAGKTDSFYAKGKTESNSVEITSFDIEDYEDYSELVSRIYEDMNAIASEYSYVNGSDEENNENALTTYNKLVEYLMDLKETKDNVDYSIDGLSFTIKLPLRTFVYTFNPDPHYLNGLESTNVNTICTLEPSKYEYDSVVTDLAAETIDHSLNSYYFLANYDNLDVNLDSMTKLADYSVIIWVGHGGYNKTDHSYLKLPNWVDADNPNELKGISKELYKKYANDFANGILVDEHNAVGATAKFFNKYYRDKHFNNTLFFLGACSGAYDSELVDALQNLGVKTVLAFSDNVNQGYCDKMIDSFFNSLAKKEETSDKTTTAISALRSAQKTHGNKDKSYSIFNYIMDNSHAWVEGKDTHWQAELLLFGDPYYRLSDNDYSYDDSLFDYEIYRVYDPYEDETLTGIAITSYNGNDTSVRIPKEIDGYAVYGIGSEAFLGKDKIETVFIPNSVRTIGESAFENCNNLKSVNIPNRLLRLDSNAFFHCNQLQQVKFPDTLTTIGNSAFNGCTALDEIVLPSKIEELGDSCFKGTSISSVFIPKTIKKARFAFSETNSIITFSIEKGLDTIPSYLFSKSTAQSITIPDTVKTIERCAFRACNNLEMVIIPDSVTTIYGDNLFYKCINLTEVYIPGNAKIWTAYDAVSGSPNGGPSDMNMHMFSRSGIKTVYSSKGSDAEKVVQLGYADEIRFVEADKNPYI